MAALSVAGSLLSIGVVLALSTDYGGDGDSADNGPPEGSADASEDGSTSPEDTPDDRADPDSDRAGEDPATADEIGRGQDETDEAAGSGWRAIALGPAALSVPPSWRVVALADGECPDYAVPALYVSTGVAADCRPPEAPAIGFWARPLDPSEPSGEGLTVQPLVDGSVRRTYEQYELDLVAVSAPNRPLSEEVLATLRAASPDDPSAAQAEEERRAGPGPCRPREAASGIERGPDGDREAAAVPAGWEALPPPPEWSGRTPVWTGTELLLLGGGANAAFDTHEGTWRCLPPSPIGDRPERAAAVWTGREALLWTETGAAAYHPASGTWRPLDALDLGGGRPLAMVWTGREVLAWTGIRGARAVVYPGGVAYDPLADRTWAISDAPVTLNTANALWNGREVLVYGSNLGSRNQAGRVHGLAYDRDRDEWRLIAQRSLSPQASSIAWTGTGMLAWDYLGSAAVYDPDTDAWRGVADPPWGAGECYPQSASIGDDVLAWFCGLAARYDAASGTWDELETPADVLGGALVSTGSGALLVHMPAQGAPSALWHYQPQDPQD